jgi:hypothetical protein
VFVARGNSPGKKMWWTLLRREISSNHWEVQSCSQDALLFIPFKLGGGEGRFFFFLQFSLFPNVFPQCSLQVPDAFPKCSPSSQCVPQHVLHISTSLLAHMFWHFHLCRWAQGEELHTSKQNLLFWGTSIVSFCSGTNGPIKLVLARILAHFVHQSEHFGGFTNGEFWHQARADRHPISLYK